MPGIQSRQKEGNEVTMFEIFQQHFVGVNQYFVQLQLHGGKAAHIGSSERHDQCGAEAMTFGIGNGNHKRAIGHGDEIEVVAAGFVGRVNGRANVKARYRGWGGVQALLHSTSQVQLEFLLLLLPRLGDVLRYRDKVNQTSGLVAHRRDGLLGPIEFTSLFAIDDHSLKWETLSKPRPHLPVKLRIV